MCSLTRLRCASLAVIPVGVGSDSEKTVPILAPQFWHSTRPMRIGTPHWWHTFDIGDIRAIFVRDLPKRGLILLLSTLVTQLNASFKHNPIRSADLTTRTAEVTKGD